MRAPMAKIAAKPPSAQLKRTAQRSAKLTEAAVRAATSEDGAQRTLWDVEYKGFGVRVGKTSKTFVVFRRIKGSKQPRYFTLGSYPTMTVDEARTKARHYINQIKDGTDPVYAQRQKEAEGVTFGQAWKLFRERMEARKYSARTVGRYAHYVDKYLGPWLKVPLAQFDPAWLREQHRALKRDIAAGRYALVIKRTSRRAG